MDLLKHWDEFAGAAAGKKVFLALDYDGTLTPIVRRPEQALLSGDMRDALRRLAGEARCVLAIISGRAREDVRAQVGIDGIVYSGNHGMEIEGPGISFLHPAAVRLRDALDAMQRRLSEGLAGIPGVLIEHKGFSLSVHYRMVSGRVDRERVWEQAHATSRPYVENGSSRLTYGKEVIEIRPSVDWNKGNALTWLMQRFEPAAGNGLLTVYCGDDATDEDAFRALGNRGIPVFVGAAGNPHARYRLADTREMLEFLRRLRELLSDKGECAPRGSDA